MKNSFRTSFIAWIGFAALAGLTMVACTREKAPHTRGIGVYPGREGEQFGPDLMPDRSGNRNLALNRAAYSSSSYDYNHTAQLVTDGIIDTAWPKTIIAVNSNTGLMKRQDREQFIDHNMMSSTVIPNSQGWVDIGVQGWRSPFKTTRVQLSGSLIADEKKPGGYEFVLLGSDDDFNWTLIRHDIRGGLPGNPLPNPHGWPLPKGLRVFSHDFLLADTGRYLFYRAAFKSPNARSWNISELHFFNGTTETPLLPSQHFTSAWMSEGRLKEWVYVDLGTRCKIKTVILHWINRATTGVVQVSDDAENWIDAGNLPENELLTDAVPVHKKARYVRVLMEESSNTEHYILSEMEVIGKGGLIARPHAPAQWMEGRLPLAGGAWKLQRSSLVKEAGQLISDPGFNPSGWVVATVPGTVLTSYRNTGAIADPDYSDNQLMISESFFNSDFWYRNEFVVPSGRMNEKLFLNFDGINWKADVFINGTLLGTINGAFIRKKFDITSLVRPGQTNALAVLIRRPENPGRVTEQSELTADPNGGALGADNPTFHASVGWDWMPTIRGRNIGIWNDVYLTSSGPVTLENPFVSADLPLPDTHRADIGLEVTLKNHLEKSVVGILKCRFGNLSFEQDISLGAGEEKRVRMDPSVHPQLRIPNPRLWWPNGYGEQYLYPVELRFLLQDHRLSDSLSFHAGIREMGYDESNGTLKIYVNGQRFIGFGGNWGFSESNLRYRSREYDVALRYHKDMHFNLIRNWVGQTADDEFYEACDRHGIMVWQDYWLANPVDGPNPADNDMFMANARDYVLRIRNHPSVALYCGRNEGDPPPVLDNGLRALIPELHPGLHYISNSAFGVVSGGGPYRLHPDTFYFSRRATSKLHTELGMPNVVNIESLQLMMPDSTGWPIGRIWGIHDYCLESAQRTSTFSEAMELAFGKTAPAHEWLSLAQLLNYQGYRAMFEAQSRNRMGLLLWMSHPAWPSLVWQTYDYYFEPTGAYFGCKKACEPLHIQWNASTDSVEVVNYSAGNRSGLTATAQILTAEGYLVWEKKAVLDSRQDSRRLCFPMEYPENLSSVFYIRLKLEENERLVSENFYWQGLQKGNYQPLWMLPETRLKVNTRAILTGDRWLITSTLENHTGTPALLIRMKAIRKKTGDRILPVLYSDNYFSLMPGESRTVTMEVRKEDARGEKPGVVISGFNLRE